MARTRKKHRGDEPADFLDSRFFRFGSKFALGTAVVVVFLTLAQCTIKKPESPEWTTSLTVPLINRTYPMSELVWRMDQEGLEMDDEGNITFSITEEIDTIQLDQAELSTTDIDTTVAHRLGEIELDPPIIDPVIVGFSEIAPLSLGVMPPVSFSLDNDLPTFGNFAQATIASGEMYVVVDNNLGVDLDTVTISVFDVANPVSPNTITSQTFPYGISDGTADSVYVLLDGMTISNTLKISASCHTPGGTVLTADDKSIMTDLNFKGQLIVQSANSAYIPALLRSDTTRVELGEAGETSVIHHAVISDGDLHVNIANNTTLDATLWLTFPDLKQNDQPLVIQRSILSSGVSTVDVDLSVYELVPSDLTAPQQLDILVDVQTVADLVHIDQDQAFAVSASLTSLAFSSITGVFSETEATIEPSHEEIDVPDGFDGFEMASVVITLTIENGVQLPGSLNVHLVGDNGQELDVAGTILAGTADSAITSIIVNDQAASFLSPIPEDVEITGTAIFGDGVSLSTITPEDYLHATVNFVAPLEMVVTGSKIESEVEEEDIDIEDIDIVTEHVEQIRFVYEAINTLPIGLSANVYLSKTSDISVSNYDLGLTDLAVPSAPFVNGLSTGFTSNLDTLLLSNDDIRILETDSLYIITEFVLDDSDGEAVRLLADNSVTIQGRLEVEYRFDGEF